MMNTTIKLHNNFEVYKKEFVKDTGLEYSKEQMPNYLIYCNCRWLDTLVQYISIKANELIQLQANQSIRISGSLNMILEEIKALNPGFQNSRNKYL